MIIMNRDTIIENINQAPLGLNIILGEHNDLVNDLIYRGVTEVVSQMNDEGITDPYEVAEGIGTEAFLDMICVDIDYLYDVNEDVDYSDMHPISYDEETHQDNVKSYIQYDVTSAIAHAVRTIIENIYGDDPCSIPNDLSWGDED